MAAKNPQSTSGSGTRGSAVKNAGKNQPAGVGDALECIRTGDVQPLYLLYGEESFLQEYFLTQLQELWLGSAPGGLAGARENGKAMSQAQAVDLACQLTFFSERRLVVIDEPAFIPIGASQGDAAAQNAASPEEPGEQGENPDAQPEENSYHLNEDLPPQAASVKKRAPKGAGAAANQPLLGYIEQPVSGVCMVLRVRKGKPDRRHKLVGEIARKGWLVEADVLTPENRLPYLKQEIQDMGKQCPQGLLMRLARQPGDLAFCMRELEKLVTYAGEEPVLTKEMLDSVLTPNTESNVFRLVDAMGKRRCTDALGELRALLENGESPFVVFSMMLRQFRLLFKAKACTQAGLPRDRMMQVLGVRYPFMADNAAAQSRLFSFPDLERAMSLLCETDLAMKSSGAGERRNLLVDLIITLTQ